MECSFPEHLNISKIAMPGRGWPTCEDVMGCVHIHGLEKPTQELGKKWWEQGRIEHNKVSHTKCFAKFSALSGSAFPSSGQQLDDHSHFLLSVSL